MYRGSGHKCTRMNKIASQVQDKGNSWTIKQHLLWLSRLKWDVKINEKCENNEICSSALHKFKLPCLAYLMHTLVTNHPKVINLPFTFICHQYYLSCILLWTWPTDWHSQDKVNLHFFPFMLQVICWPVVSFKSKNFIQQVLLFFWIFCHHSWFCPE